MSARPRIAVLVTAHPVDDMRVYHREALSMAEWADVTVFGLRSGDGSRAGAVPLVEVPARPGRLWRILVAPWQVVSRALESRPDILHVHDPELLPAALLRSRRVRVVFDDHENYPEVMLSKHWLPHILRRPARWGMIVLYRIVARVCALIITPTVSLAEEFRSLGARVAVVRNFPPATVFAADLASTDPRAAGSVDVIHLGTVSELRLGTFAEIIGAVWALRPETTWRFVGLSTASSTKLDELLAPAVREMVDTRGFVPAEQVPAELRQGRVGINWHPDIPQFRTAIPNKLPEYLSVGMRVVTTEIPELATFLPAETSMEHGVTYGPRESSGFAACIVEQLAQVEQGAPPSGEEISRAVRSSMSWEHEAETLRTAYAEMLGSEVD